MSLVCLTALLVVTTYSSPLQAYSSVRYPFPVVSPDPWGYTRWQNGPIVIRDELALGSPFVKDGKSLLSIIQKSSGEQLIAAVEQYIPIMIISTETDSLLSILSQKLIKATDSLVNEKSLSQIDQALVWSCYLAHASKLYVGSYTGRHTSNREAHFGIALAFQYGEHIVPKNNHYLWIKAIGAILSINPAEARKLLNELCLKFSNNEGLYMMRVQTWLSGNNTNARMDPEKVTAMLDYAIKKWPNYPRLWYLYGWWHKGEVQSRYWTKYRNAKSGTFRYELESILKK